MEHLLGPLRPVVELTAVIPAAILCLLPMKGRLRVSRRFLALWGFPLLLVWAVLGGLICWRMHWDSNLWLFPWLAVFGPALCRMVNLPGWKSVSVMLSSCAVFSFMGNLAILADANLDRGNPGPWYTLPGAVIYAGLCWLLLLCLWHPATHAARWLLQEVEIPGTWYVFWILPVIFTALNIFLQPDDYDTLYTGRLMVIDLVVSLLLLGLLLFMYLLFYLMARGMGRGMRLARENEILQIQAAQYRNMQKSMEDVRRARHDLRHHFFALQGYAEQGDLKAVADYVADYCHTMPRDLPQSYCRNSAVNAVLSHYAEQAAQQDTDMTISVQMAEAAVIPEPELCALLGNLLENALDACAAQAEPCTVQVHISQEGSSTLAIAVDNPCPQPPRREGDRLVSTKHKGLGFGTQSVRITAEHYHGDARFEWRDGVFRASVLLNP